VPFKSGATGDVGTQKMRFHRTSIVNDADSTVAYLPGAHFHLLTPLYEFLARPMLAGVWRAVADDVSKAAGTGAAVIDFGCGPGTILRRLATSRPDLKITGVDVDPRMLSICRRRLPQARLLRASIDAVPIEDKSADVVFSSMVFHHLPRQVKEGAFREAKRILKPRGLFLLCDFSQPIGGPGAWFIGLFGRIESGVANQAAGELVTIAQSESMDVVSRWTRLGCITQHEIRGA
jgi:ubiquinone/menaquinone biosynthesis C-methylase UbiE